MRFRRRYRHRYHHRGRALRAVWAPSIVRRLVRHRGLWATVILVGGCSVAFVLTAKVAAIDAERARWGVTTSAVVVVDRVAIGDPIDTAVERRELPAAMVPANAATSWAPGSLAKVTLHPGEIMLADRVTASFDGRTAPGTVALTLPVVRQVPLVEIGAVVDLWSVDSANLSSRRIAQHVAVLAFSDDDITVAVPDAQVGAATAASLRPVTVTLVG